MNKLVLILIAVAAIVGIILFVGRQGGQAPYFPNIPGVSQGTAIQSAQDLKAAQSDLDNTDVDASMSSDLNQLSSDGSSL